MKLGILVVYLVDERSERLLEIHLGQIERCTSSPWTIYAGVNRLDPKYRERLARHPLATICDIPPSELRGGAEHAYCLDHLARQAVDDGATHVVTLHLDSFPICDGWDVELAGRLTGSCVLATITRINTACLMFRSDFYLEHRPTFRLTDEQRRDPCYRSFLEEHNPYEHSGVGYVFTAYRHELEFWFMRATAVGQYPQEGVFDDLVYHVGGASFLPDLEPPRRLGRITATLARSTAGLARAVLPAGAQRALKARFGKQITRLISRPQATDQAERIRRLLADPEAHLPLSNPRQRGH